MSHPYISGASHIAQILVTLKKNFPQSITSETIKKLGLAPNNESSVINAINFIGLIDDEGKRTEHGHSVFLIHDEEKFKVEFGKLVSGAYDGLFDLHGDGAWDLDKSELIGFFRTTDKTSETIGTRQANVFRVFAAAAGHLSGESDSKPTPAQRPQRARAVAGSQSKVKKPKVSASSAREEPARNGQANREMALTVRIEINLPSGGSKDDYDQIFKSIKAHILGD